MTLDIDRVRHQRRSRALDVFSQFDKLPTDSQVLLIWMVLEEGRIVTHDTRANTSRGPSGLALIEIK